ncbi:MAG: hypothetical protein WAS55_01145 [Saprospiraceae bacterium]
MKHLLIFVLLSGILNPSFAIPGELSLNSASQVLDRIFQSTGNFILLKPKLKISNREQAVAQYVAGENLILIERKAMRICWGFGKDSLDALAFIIGHELAHFYSLQSKKSGYQTNYLARNLSGITNEQEEQEADIQGVFSAWIADYKSIDILPALLNTIYKEYQLTNKLNGYPELRERQSAANAVVKQVKTLIGIFEISSFLISAHEYELAVASYEYLESFYQSREIYNNIGLCYALQSLQLANVNSGSYIQVFELDPVSRLKKPINSRGLEARKNEELRLYFLDKAKDNFLKAKSFSYNYFEAELNLMSVYVLEGKFQTVINRLNENELAKLKLMGLLNGKELNQSRAVLGIALANSGLHDEAAKIFEKILKFTVDLGLKALVKYNLEVLRGTSCSFENSFTCPKIQLGNDLIDGVKLHRLNYIGQQIELNANQVGLSILQYPESEVYNFTKNNKNVFSIQKVKLQNTIKLTDKFDIKMMLHSKNTIYLYCNEQKRILNINGTDLSVKDYAKFYRY